MRRAGTYLAFCLAAVLLYSCKKDIPPQRTSAGSITTGKRLIICNEGNFGQGNATISVFDPATGNVVQDAYGPANSNQYVGDVLQSVKKFGVSYYWLLNNSGKVVVTDGSFVKQSVITGFISPRYIEFVSNDKAYVTNLQLNPNLPNYIQVLDINSKTVSKAIRLDGWTEQMAQSFGKVFVCNQRRNYVYVIDAATDLVADSIHLNATSACIVKDQDEKLWVSCNANAGSNTPARLVRINPVTHLVEADISLGTTQSSISNLAINGNGTTLYFLMNDVYRFPFTATAPGPVFIAQGSRAYYGICVDPSDETIYIADAVDFNQNGNVWRYGPSANYLGTFKAGLIPGSMLIDE